MLKKYIHSCRQKTSSKSCWNHCTHCVIEKLILCIVTTVFFKQKQTLVSLQLFLNVYMLLIIKKNFLCCDETPCNLNKYFANILCDFSQLDAAMCRDSRPHKKANKQYLFTKGTSSSVCFYGSGLKYTRCL